MGNISKANAPGFGGEITECYIQDLEKLTHGNEYRIIFQRLINKGQVIKVKTAFCNRWNFDFNRTEKDTDPPVLVPLFPEDWIYGLPEYYGCFWLTRPVTPKRIKESEYMELIYEWEMEDKPDTLIWWDLDLGDVVLDTIIFDDKDNSDADGVPTGKDDYNLIADNVYFYWIT